MKPHILVARAIVPHPQGLHKGVLVVRRAGGKFNLPGGKALVKMIPVVRTRKDGSTQVTLQSKAEKPLQTARRELFEEARVKAVDAHLVHRESFRKRDPTHKGEERIHQMVFEVTKSRGRPRAGREVQDLRYYIHGKHKKVPLTGYSKAAIRAFLKTKKEKKKQ